MMTQVFFPHTSSWAQNPPVLVTEQSDDHFRERAVLMDVELMTQADLFWVLNVWYIDHIHINHLLHPLWRPGPPSEGKDARKGYVLWMGFTVLAMVRPHMDHMELLFTICLISL